MISIFETNNIVLDSEFLVSKPVSVNGLVRVFSVHESVHLRTEKMCLSWPNNKGTDVCATVVTNRTLPGVPVSTGNKVFRLFCV